MSALAQLPKLEQAKQLLAECTSVEEAKHFHDVAEAARQYSRMNGLGLEAQNLATEIKVRAGRRAGELLSKVIMKGRPKKSDNTVKLLKVDEAGFSHRQSSQFQRLAAVPAKQLEAYLADSKQKGREITTSAILRMGKAAKNTKPRAPSPAAVGCIMSLDEIAGQKFGTIYADPPWAYSNKATRSNVSDEYVSTMTIDDICDMPVGYLAADDAHLHLWTTNGFLHDAFHVMQAWGFDYRSCFVWCKPQMGIGNYWRVSHEFLLLGIRGDAKSFAEHSHMSWKAIDRGAHSAKPEEIRGIIERVSPGPFLELFGRKEVPGWIVLGNQFEEQRRLA